MFSGGTDPIKTRRQWSRPATRAQAGGLRAGLRDLSRLSAVPVTSFAMVMGVGGLGLAWRKAHEVLGWPALIGNGLLAAQAGLFMVVLGLYGFKLLRHPALVTAEFRHPLLANFFPALGINVLIMAEALLPDNPEAANPLWLAGAGFHLGLMVLMARRWLVQPYEPRQVTPPWFIPVVGNILAPLAGVPLGHTELSWFLLAAGLAGWVLLFPILFHRLLCLEPLPPTLTPTLCFLMAPPAVGFLSYTALLGGQPDGVARLLLFTALFEALVMLAMVGRFLRTPLAANGWAYGFPVAVLALALLGYHKAVPGAASGVLAAIALLAATAIVAGVTVRGLFAFDDQGQSLR
ncbi:tellurite resistance protein [uncultured Gammaproteobacteria bacterium]